MYDIGSELLRDILKRLVEETATKDQGKRIAAWKERLRADLTERTRWVMREPCFLSTKGHEDPHPVKQAERMRAELEPRWCKVRAEQLAWPPEVMAWIASKKQQAPETEWQGHDLYLYATKGRGTGAGPDQWTASHLCMMGEEFWERLADLWKLCMQTKRLPEAWLHARVVGIPKPGSDEKRPISVAAVCWRIGIGYQVYKLREWVDQWAPPEVVGGLAGRDPADFYDAFSTTVAEAASAGQCILGCKLDLEKCFDLVCYEDANRMLKELGAPQAFIDILEVFDELQVRHIECERHVHPEPMRPQRSLMQGCPASPLRLTVVMAAWVYYMRSRAPTANVSMHMDDRILYQKSRSMHTIKATMAENAKFEKIFDMKDNAKK